MMSLLEHEIKYLAGGNFHEKTDDCQIFGCCIHNPTDHSMRNMRMFWRSDRALMERICEHGVGHPDPDHMNWYGRKRGDVAATYEGIHGCDGCCHDQDEKDEANYNNSLNALQLKC